MKVAQQEIKATVTVNTSDLGNKKKDDEIDRDAPSRKKGKCFPAHSPLTNWSSRLQTVFFLRLSEEACCSGYDLILPE